MFVHITAYRWTEEVKETHLRRSRFPETQSQVGTGGCEVTTALDGPEIQFLIAPHHLIKVLFDQTY